MISGAAYVVKALQEENVEILFNYPGAATIDIMDELYKQDQVKVILPRHEQALAHAADGYARSTGKVGVCMVTSGPGATNLVTGIATAYADSVPLVCITGQVDLGFTHIDYVGQLQSHILYQDYLYAVLPSKHPLAKQNEVSLADLAKTELILLDEGENSLTRAAFEKAKITPTFAYEIYDDYTILEMIRQDLGASLLYENFLDGLTLDDLTIRHISEKPFRTIVLAWKNWQTLPLAAQEFAKTISSKMND